VVASEAHSRPKFRRLNSEERRQTLVKAALSCLSRFGPHGTGVREICHQVNVSPGLLSHYFESKEALIHEALRTLTRDFHEKMQRVLTADLSAEQRLQSSFETYMSSRVTDAERAGAYLAFWTLARTDPAVRRIQRAAYRKQQQLFENALKALAAERGVRIEERKVAIGLVSLLDGLWLEICLDPAAFSRATAVSVSWDWLDAVVRRSPRRRTRKAAAPRR
jgi:AcrR family transcriptional regulator